MEVKGYVEIADAIMQGKVKAFAQLAINKGKSVKGLGVDDSGKVLSISGDGKKVIAELLEKFEEIAGKTSTITARMAIMNIKSKYPKLALPDGLN